jgi:hypothetical protein
LQKDQDELMAVVAYRSCHRGKDERLVAMVSIPLCAGRYIVMGFFTMRSGSLLAWHILAADK